MSNRVFIPNSGARHDFSPAEEYGELLFISDGYLNPFKTGYMVRLWEEALKDSGSDDYILICSLPVLCAIGTAMFANKHGKVNLLQYRKRGNKYDVQTHVLNKE